ncbi:MAG: Na/Pi symporter [Methylovirgula sp.]|uniref:Na/Pi cotransporter family protein n=1 Tax=Methylovirgula sp. TaxID=1978224 RepID=UPI003076212A
MMLTLDTFATILAGLGLFSVGTKGLAANLGQLAGRSLRQWVARSTGNYLMSAAIGVLAGALVQSANAITVILMSMVKADLITPSRARPILVWSNVGTSILVLAVAIDIHIFVLLLTATTGMFYYLNLDRAPRWRPFVAALLAISLLFLGLQLMHSGNHELRNIEWVREFFEMSARWTISAFIIGAVLALALQSSSTVAVIAISMSAAGLLTLEQAMLTVLGATAGSGVSIYLDSSGMEGSSRQLAILQALIKILAVAVLVLLVVVERTLHVPLLAHLYRVIAGDVAKQVALVYLTCQIAAVIVQVLFDRALQPLLSRLAPPSLEETASKPRYIYEQALAEPETALALVDREQVRIFGFLPLHLDVVDRLESEETIRDRHTILAAATSLDEAVTRFLTELADAGASRNIQVAIANRQARSTFLQSLHEALHELGEALAGPFELPSLKSLAENLSEGLAALLMVAYEAVRDGDADDLALLQKLTADRDSLVDQMRRRVVSADKSLSARDQQTLYAITSLFERIVWMLRRFGALLVVDADREEPTATLETQGHAMAQS